jgi:hypothetical protein
MSVDNPFLQLLEFGTLLIGVLNTPAVFLKTNSPFKEPKLRSRSDESATLA